MRTFATFEPTSPRRSPVKFEIRRAVPNDAPRIAALDAPRHGLEVDDIEPKVRRSIERGANVWIATVDQRFCGYSKAVWVDAERQRALGRADGLKTGFYLMGLSVRPDQRRSGLGMALTEVRLRWMERHGGTDAYYFTNAKNRASMALHDRLGFSQICDDVWVPAVPDPKRPQLLHHLSLRPDLAIRQGSDLPVDDVVALYNAVGWTAYTDNPTTLMASLAGSSWVISRWSGDSLVALCRVLSDDATTTFIQDILVHPDWQRRGLGRQLVELVLDRYRHVRQVQLLTDDRDSQHAFYRSLGFTDTRGTVLHSFVRIDGL